MGNKSIKPPDNRNYEYALNQSYQLAIENLLKVKDLGYLCQKSDCRYQEDSARKVISLNYLGRTYQIRLPEVSVSFADSDEEVPLRERILILHYVLTAKGTPLANIAITFKELPEGAVYFRTFYQRTIKPLVENFSKEPARLFEVARQFGGQKAEYGDAAVTIYPFSRVPVTLVLWRGDSDFPPEGNILYDSTVTDYLPTEDIIVLTETLVWKLVRIGKGK